MSATKSAHDALRLYALLDDQAGQLRSHINLTRLFILQNQQDKAEKHLTKATALTREVEVPLQQYQVHLLAGKLHQDDAAFAKARDNANSPLEQAVAEAYLHHYQQAYDLVGKQEATSAAQADDMAFVFLRYAQFSDDADAAERALALFKKNENTIGISDALYIRAVIARKNGEHTQAEYYLRRALEVNLAMGDKQRIATTIEALAGSAEK